MENIVRKISWYSFLTLIMVVIIGVIVWYKPIVNVEQGLGGSAGEPYNATSSFDTVIFKDIVLQEGQGTFGSYIVTGVNTTWLEILDATTTDINLRTGKKATSTIIMASIPPSLAAGTYVFDSVFTDGLYLDVRTAGVGTSTITWR